MAGRSWNDSTYRYGFNGMEKDDEVKGGGNHLDFGARGYDPRLGRFLSVDPLFKQFPELTPYQFASNRPIDGIDIDGLEHASYLVKLNDRGKVIQSLETSRNIYHVGQQGWGTRYTFVDEKGNKVFQVFKPSDPPLIWTGANRPLYVSGVKVLGYYDELTGADGFKNGGWQAMVGTAGLLLGAGELAIAKTAGQIIWGIISTAIATDDLISTDGKSLSENIAGSNTASGIINLSKSALSFKNAVSSTLSQIDEGANAIKAISTLVDTYGGVENFKEALNNFKTEVKQGMERQNSEKNEPE